MKLGKIFICINILVLSLLMLTGCTEKWPRIIYQNTSYRFDEYNRTIVLDDGYVLDGGHSYDIVETENDSSFYYRMKRKPPAILKEKNILR